MSKNVENRGCLSLILGFFGQKPAKPVLDESKALKDLPYRLRDDFFSPAELSFYHVLSLAAPSKVVILGKVRLADLFFVLKPNENRKYFNYIVGKHIDFLVCDSSTLKPLVGIELDDASHDRDDRIERDEFVNQVFETAKLPLLHFAVRRTYRVEEIQSALVSALPESYVRVEELNHAASDPVSTNLSRESSANNPANVTNVSAATTAPICPKCQVPMVLRTVASGEHKGKQFWGCSNYPNCRQVKPLKTV